MGEGATVERAAAAHQVPVRPASVRSGDRRAGDRPMADLPVPWGWFAVAFAYELRPGRVLTRRLAGREIVLWRGHDGSLGATDPTCPHLGAHLGQGDVRGADLRCPFHSFTFASDGRCTSTGGPSAPPAGLCVASHHVVERNGAVLVWHDPAGTGPTFDVPELPVAPMTRVDRTTTSCFSIAGHPVSTSENSVDLAHLAAVHHYEDVRMEVPFHSDGPSAFATYSMTRPFGLPGGDRLPGGRRSAMRVRFDVALHGLGVSVVEASIPKIGARTRQLVLATPVEPGRIELRLSLRLLHTGSAVRRAAEVVGARLAAIGFAHDVRQDLPIWDQQRYVTRPALAHGDGPIVPYRRWAQQFLEPSTPVDAEG